ncbi:MAG: ATP-binding protein, partial [Pseudomonadota bacterium]
MTTELQDSLIRTRMLPFSSYTPRLERVVRSAARDMGKRVAVSFNGATGELDRQVLQRMMPAFEHLLRNAVAHGVEMPAQRAAAGKPETGNISVTLRREGTEMAIVVQDDGAGLNIERIRRIAIERGLLPEGQDIDAGDALNLILSPGFSTAAEVTQDAGRGVGMDVVANEIKLLGGSLSVESTPGAGTEFTARLPLTLAVTQALLVRCGEDQFAVPLPAVEGIVRVPRDEVQRYRKDPSGGYAYGDQTYRVEHLGHFVRGGIGRLRAFFHIDGVARAIGAFDGQMFPIQKQ